MKSSKRAICAIVFALLAAPGWARAGTEKVIYSFKGGADGSYPTGRLTRLGDLLYGTTAFGGHSNSCFDSYGCGTVFSVSTAGAEAVIHAFAGAATDGSNPVAGVISVGNSLYGTTGFGGADGNGAVFSLTPGGVEKLVHSLANAEGSDLQSGLLDESGLLYGTIETGYGRDAGAAFSLTRAGKLTILHSFKHGNDPEFPASGLIDAGGRLYGTTASGGHTSCSCGAVFSLTTTGHFRTVYAFQGGTGASRPNDNLIFSGGLFYGEAGGGANGMGAIFTVTRSGVEKVLYSFAGGADGAGPAGGLIRAGDAFYGVTYAGGGSGCGGSGCGTVFSITPYGIETVVYAFQGSADGATPYGALLDVAGALYGTTEAGGAAGDGTVFRIKP